MADESDALRTEDSAPPRATIGSTRLQRRLIFVTVLVLVSLPIIIATVRDLHLLARAVGDSAIIEMYADDMPGRLPLIGVYSRFEFHHPGPSLYYLVAIPIHLFGARGLPLTGALVAIASLGGILFLLHRRGGAPLFVLGTILCLVLVRVLALDVLSAWNPNILILPFALSVVLAWSVWCRDWWALPWTMLVGSFVVQAHIGTAPSIALLLGTSTVWGIVEAIRRRGAWRPIIVSAAVAAVTWLPALIDELTNDPGNLSQILAVRRSGEPTLGLSKALGLLGYLFGGTDPIGSGDITPLTLFGSARSPQPLQLAVPVLVLAVSAVLALRTRLHDELKLTAILAGLMGTSLIFLAAISGPPYLYLVRWTVVIVCLLWMNLCWILLRSIQPLVERRRAAQPTPGLRPSFSTTERIAMVLAGGVLLLIGLIPLATTANSRSDIVGSRVVTTFGPPLRRATDGCDLISVRPTGESSFAGISIASGVMADLRHDGLPIVIDDALAYSHGPQHSLDGRAPDCTIVLSASEDAVIPPVAPEDGRVVARLDTLTPVQRANFQRLDEKRSRGPLSTAQRGQLRRLRGAAHQFRASVVRGRPSV